MFNYVDPQTVTDQATGVTAAQQPEKKEKAPAMAAYFGTPSGSYSATSRETGTSSVEDDIKLAAQMAEAQLAQYKYLQAQREAGNKPELSQEEIDRKVDAQLGGAKFKFGFGDDWNTIETDWEWNNKFTLAAAIGVGDGIGELARGLRQALTQTGAVTLIDEERQNENEQILRELYDSKYKYVAGTGYVGGLVAEGIATLPLFPAKFYRAATIGDAFVKSGVMAGLYGAGMYVEPNESRAFNAAAGFLLGGATGAIAQKLINQFFTKDVVKAINGAREHDVEVDKAIFQKWADATDRGKAGNIDANVARAKERAESPRDYAYDPVTKRYTQKSDAPSSTAQFERRYAEDRVNKEAEMDLAYKQRDYNVAEAKVREEAESALMWEQYKPTPKDPRGKLHSAEEYRRALERVEREAAERLPKDIADKLPTEPRIDAVGVLSTAAEKKKAKALRKKIKAMNQKAAKQAAKQKKETPADVVEGIEIKAAVEGAKAGLLHRNWGVVDRMIRPLYDYVKHGIGSARVAGKMRISDAIQHQMQAGWMHRAKDFITWMDRLTPDQKLTLKRLLHNGGMNKATLGYINQIGGNVALNKAKQAQRVMRDIMKQYKGVGYKIGDLGETYFPLSVKDFDGLSKTEMGRLEKALAAAAKQKGRALTKNEKDLYLENYLTKDPRYGRTSGNIKQRTKKEVSDEELDFYWDNSTALQYYIHTAAEDLARRKFFQGFGYKPGKNGLDVTGGDLDKSIATLVDQVTKVDGLNMKQQAELVEVLRKRYSSDVNKVHSFVQDLKNASYAGTLGNWWSAMTQIGDLVFAMHKYGIKATVESMFSGNVTDKVQLGIEKAMAEMHADNRRFMNKLADFAFKWSGFDAVDTFGKNVNINASLRANKKLAMKNPEAFKKKWEPFFEGETDDLIRELTEIKLKKGEPISDNAHYMLWSDLADTQPIGLSEMPYGYLAAPNGRLFYAYKTFALKQFNYQRNLMLEDKNVFRKAANLTWFATLFVMANGSIDGLKDFIAGKPIYMEEKVYDNILSLVGTSKYAADKAQGLGGVIAQMLQPVPVMQHLSAADKITSPSDLEMDDFTNIIPIIGAAHKKAPWMEETLMEVAGVNQGS